MRYLVEDDALQARIARQVVDRGCYLSATVLLETAWVLRSRYGWPRDVIAMALTGFTDTPTVTVASDRFGWALGRYASGADLADMLHIAESAMTDQFATFDRKIARQVGADTPIPIETLS